MKKIRTLIVDDEPLARERLASLVSSEQDIELIGQCRDGEEAITAIQDHSPDLVFLDVQMPQMNGFEVVEAVGTEKMPLVIFVTASSPSRACPTTSTSGSTESRLVSLSLASGSSSATSTRIFFMTGSSKSWADRWATAPDRQEVRPLCARERPSPERC